MPRRSRGQVKKIECLHAGGLGPALCQRGLARTAERVLWQLRHPDLGPAFYQAEFGAETWIRPERRTQSLLITAGVRKRLVTPCMSRVAWRRQKRPPARTDFKLFPGRSQLLISGSGCEEVAAYAIAWQGS